MVEAGQRASIQNLPGQRIFCCSASFILSGHVPDELLLEQNPFLRGPVPKVGHGDLVGSDIGITRVSVIFKFFRCVYLRPLFWPLQANGWFKSLVLFFAVGLFLCLLCAGVISCYF